jgi:hypothetical protein
MQVYCFGTVANPYVLIPEGLYSTAQGQRSATLGERDGFYREPRVREARPWAMRYNPSGVQNNLTF